MLVTASTGNGSTYAASRKANVVAALEANKAANLAARIPSQISTSVLFKDGKFTGTAQLTSPKTLGTLFQLNADGSVVHGDYGIPVMKKGVQVNTAQEGMATLLAMDENRSVWTASDCASMADLDKITDDDKAMFRQVTGYNIFVAGTGAMIVDDEGNPPADEARGPINELFMRLQYARSSGQEVDAGWFHGISKDIADWGGPKFPADWDAKADEWFNDLLKARQAEKAVEANAADTQDPANKSVERYQMSAAAHAYGEAAKLATPPAI